MPDEPLTFERQDIHYTLYVLMENVEQDDHGLHFWPASEDDARRALGEVPQ